VAGCGYELRYAQGEPSVYTTLGVTLPTTTPLQSKEAVMISLEFLVTSLVVVLIPGTGVIYTVSTGLVQGRKASIYAALGCTAGIIPHLMATILGLAAVMHTSALAFQLLKYAGVAYLFYVAFATWRDKSAFAIDGSVSKTSGRRLLVKAFLLNILNPKLTIFFLAFLPQFVEPSAEQPLLQLLQLSAVFMVMTFIVFVIYGFVAHAFRRLVIESANVQRWLRYGFAAAFAGLGAKLAFTEK
jgi:threonine/homoserine/homoserine lactone efflux protein